MKNHDLLNKKNPHEDIRSITSQNDRWIMPMLRSIWLISY